MINVFDKVTNHIEYDIPITFKCNDQTTFFQTHDDP